MKLPFLSGKSEPLQAESESEKDLSEHVDASDTAGASRSGAPQTHSLAFGEPSENPSIRGLSDLYVPEESRVLQERDIADALLEMGKITDQQHAHVRQEQLEKPGSDAVTWLLKDGLINANDVLMAKAKLYGLEFREISPEDVERQAFQKLDIDFIKSSNIMPIAVEQDSLVVATSEPANIFAIEDVKRQTQMELRVVVCSLEDILAVCDSFQAESTPDTIGGYSLDDIISDMTEVEVVQDQKEEFQDLEKMAGQSPVIKFVNYLISNAVHEGASDIHIEPKETFARIRCRIDGMLFEVMQAPLNMHPAIVSRIKIMANLDISERRLPQDGKIKVSVGGRTIDLRISTLLTSYGEKVVIRVLDSKSIMRTLEQLGMEPKVCDVFRQQIALPHGILLVTGPTGSGKSTTLYSALSQMDGDKLNISTVEDPVEYELAFCNQVQTNEKIGLDFASALRSLLRQDPDVIMIGEIRDNETARIAVQAALTGHLVLSTLHTNDAASSITRLVNIGIDPYLIAASLNAVLAQRLVRKICPKCKEIYQVPEHMRKCMEDAGVRPEELFHGTGCEACRGSGYVGRVGIYELLVIDDKFRDVINKDPSVNNMRRAFHESGQPSLFDDGIGKVKQGLTTIEEVLRVTEVYGQNEEEVFVENIE
ncbi:MAG: GspE/PulE family protein [Sedimentisphaerales bacterium]